MPRNEADTRADLVDPVLHRLGWGVAEGTRINREYRIAPGRLLSGGRRAKALKADYLLWHNNRKIAVIEAKAEGLPLTEGLGQAKDYATKLGVRFTYATNGHGFYQVDMDTGVEGEISEFPSPGDLWRKTFGGESDWKRRLLDIPFETMGGSHLGRYYQESAVEAVVSAIADGKKRILVTHATGTGKTFVAFQVAWKLFQGRWNLGGAAGRSPRILFLADRNTLADQAYNQFSPFPEDALVRIKPSEIRKKGTTPTNGSVFFTIFQTFMSGTDDQGNPQPYFGEYPADFFDFIVIDECHRGAANDESEWRGILEYFSGAVQLGLTATPKREENVDTYRYFGDPVHVYSLKDGINDGFLTPFRMRQIKTSLDEYEYTEADAVIEGEIEAGRTYTEADFNRIIEIKAREAARVKIFMDEIIQSQKSIVFCANQAHALLVRDLINQYKKSTNPNYCVRVTADDLEIGDQFLRDFQDNEKSIPTVLTTSKKLTTGVDARNVRNIVLMRPVKSLIEFKQIIGRGTRLFEGKEYFTVYDFVKAYEHFSDPEWDGDPEGGDDPTTPKHSPTPRIQSTEPREPYEPPLRVRVKLADGKDREIKHTASTTFWNEDGQQVTAHEFLEQLFGELPEFFSNEEELRTLWSNPDTRQQLLTGLAERGFAADQLHDMQRLIDAERSDLFDVLAYVRFASPTQTRDERARRARSSVGSALPDRQRAFIDFVLDQYIIEGVGELSTDKLPPLLELRYGGVSDAIDELHIDAAMIRQLFTDFQRYLYAEPVAS